MGSRHLQHFDGTQSVPAYVPTRSVGTSALALAILLLAGPLIANDKTQPKKDTGIDVNLRISVDTLDPAQPGDSFIECIVRNKSPRPINVPAVYSGGYDSDMVLNSDARFNGLWLIVWAGEKSRATKKVAIAEETSIFKDTLKAVLVLDGSAEKPLVPKERRYYWTWRA